MAETREARPSMPGFYTRSVEGVTPIEIAATAATVLWLALSGGFFLLGDAGAATGGMHFLLVLMIVVLPVCLIWVAALAARSARIMRDESARLQASIDALRQAYIAQSQGGKGEPPHPAIMKRLDEIAGAQRNFEATLAMVGGVRTAEQASVSAPPPPRGADDQQMLSLGTPAEAMQPPLSKADFISALHFPETAEDKAGFAALRRALKDRNAAKLIQASQDVLTLLSENSVYMDDLRPDMARPETLAQLRRGRPRTRHRRAGRHPRPLCHRPDGGTDEGRPDLPRRRASLPAPLRPAVHQFRRAGDGRRDHRLLRHPHRPRLHAAGPGRGHLRLNTAPGGQPQAPDP
ncbi:hypothetical protein ABFB10_12165 [Ponticoccus litoralis]|uniref:Uncharacterized protein n=1 Tax=Ponticoccus litoralis TaxID=422297 RepID=A0AAW9SJN8_9RHOB